MTYLGVKRVLDFSTALAGLIVLSPLLLTIALAIKLDSPGPIIFRQRRIGIRKSEFCIFKFRTMRIDTPRDTPTHLLENPQKWITRVGCFLRRTSLDELPQLLNVLAGHMSIVGPRPGLWNQYDLVAERDRYGANDVPVGLTGWAQINGRDELPVAAKAKLDGEYVANIGLMMDLMCFLGTIVAVIKSDGVTEGSTGQSASDSDIVNPDRGV